MKCIRNAGATVYSRVTNQQAEELVATGMWTYTTRSAMKAHKNRTRKRFRYRPNRPISARRIREMMRRQKRPQISNANSTDGTKALIQRVLSGPKKILVSRYLPNHALKKINNKEITEKQAWKKYAKNRYKPNPDATVIKAIKHIKPRQGEVESQS